MLQLSYIKCAVSRVPVFSALSSMSAQLQCNCPLATPFDQGCPSHRAYFPLNICRGVADQVRPWSCVTPVRAEGGLCTPSLRGIATPVGVVHEFESGQRRHEI
jgi:hypothetical protein